MASITGQLSDGTRFEHPLHSRTRDVKIDQAMLVSIDLGAVATLKQLRSLYVRSPKLVAVDLSPLRGSPIERLQLVGPVLAEIDLSPLAASPTLQKVSISGGARALDLAPLAGCGALVDLLVFETKITAVDFAPLARCPALSCLWFSKSAMTAIDLAPLARLPRLRAMDLAGSQLTSATLGVDAGFAALTHLHLQANPIAALDLRALATAPMRYLTLPAHLEGRVDIAPLVTKRDTFELAFR